MAKFELISKYEGYDSAVNLFPRRKTVESAGYDFFVAEDTIIPPIEELQNLIFSKVLEETDGYVYPVTLDEMKICAELNDGTVIEERDKIAETVFDKVAKIERIYINFCNPWPKEKKRKKRLTHTRQLEKYKQFLQKNGGIYFKTDDDELFEASLSYFEETGFKIIKKTYNLHEEPIFENE